jgi:hypothetical protein
MASLENRAKSLFGNDQRGLQFLMVLDSGKLALFSKVKNFADKMGLQDDDVHPEIVNFLVQAGSQSNIADPDVQKLLSAIPEISVSDAVISKSNLLVAAEQPQQVFVEQVPQPQQPMKVIELIKLEGGASETLRSIFAKALQKKVSVVAPINAGAQSFGVVPAAVLENALQQIKAPEVALDLDDDYIQDLSMSNVLKLSKEGKIVRIDADGKEQEAQSDDAAQCRIIGVAPELCSATLQDIFLNQNTEAYKKALGPLADSQFADIARTEITKMDPKLAEQILGRYGFKKLNVPEDGRTVVKMESVHSWLERLSKDSSVQTLKELQSQHKLLIFFEQLVHFLNFNKVALNVKQPELQQVKDQSYLKHAKNITVVPAIPLDILEEPRNALIRMVEANRNASLLTKSVFANPFPFPIVKLPGMTGGCSTSNTLRVIILGLVDDLKRRGKTLRDHDMKKIQESLQTLERLDASLKKVAQQLTEYKDWVSIVSRKDETVGLSQISGNLDKYRECVSQYARLENGLLEVAQKLSEL